MPEPPEKRDEDILLLGGNEMDRVAAMYNCEYEVSHVSDPLHIFLNRPSHIHQAILDAIKLCLPHCYRAKTAADCARVSGEELCLVPDPQNVYRRAIIKEKVAMKTLAGYKVQFIDTGKEGIVMGKDRRFLRCKVESDLPKKKISEIVEKMYFLRYCPAQAIKCVLDGLDKFTGQDYLKIEQKDDQSSICVQDKVRQVFMHVTKYQTLLLTDVDPDLVSVRQMNKLPDITFKMKAVVLDERNRKRDLLSMLRAKYGRSDLCLIDAQGDRISVIDAHSQRKSQLGRTAAFPDNDDNSESETFEESVVNNMEELIHPVPIKRFGSTVHLWISHKVGPHLFYAHPIASAVSVDYPLFPKDGKEALKSLFDLATDIDEYYFKPTNRIPVVRSEVQESWTQGKRVYAATLRGEGTPQCGSEWRRVEVTRPIAGDTEDSFVKVHYLDWGGEDIKDFGDLYRLSNSLLQVHAQVWRCSLSGFLDGDEREENVTRLLYHLRSDVPCVGIVDNRPAENIKADEAFRVHLQDVFVPGPLGKVSKPRSVLKMMAQRV